MERYNGVELDPEGAFVYYDDAQRALDAEREKVKRLSTCGTDHSTPWWQVKCEDLEAQLATLQAQLTRLEEEYAEKCIAKDNYITTLIEAKNKAKAQLAGLKRNAGLDCGDQSCLYAVEHTGMRTNGGCRCDPKRMKDDLVRSRKACDALQAQLRQVEGQSKQQAEEAVIVFAKYTTLQQLVAALPVVDVQEDSVWLSPDESGWFVSKRPAFPAGLYWAKFRTQAEADSFRALLAYRATLDQDAGKGYAR